MLTVVSEVERKIRKPAGGLQYVLRPIAQQSVFEGADVDLDRTYVTISDPAYAKEVLRPHDLAKAEKGATEAALQAGGALYLNVFVAAESPEICRDLEKALLSRHLLVSLTTGSNFGPSDKSYFEKWLNNQRHSEDITVWSDRVPEFGLVLRK